MMKKMLKGHDGCILLPAYGVDGKLDSLPGRVRIHTVTQQQVSTLRQAVSLSYTD